MAELVIPGGIVGGQIVVVVLAVVDGVGADIDVVAALRPGVADAGIAGELGVRRPGRSFAAAGKSDLGGPVVAPFVVALMPVCV